MIIAAHIAIFYVGYRGTDMALPMVYRYFAGRARVNVNA